MRILCSVCLLFSYSIFQWDTDDYAIPPYGRAWTPSDVPLTSKCYSPHAPNHSLMRIQQSVILVVPAESRCLIYAVRIMGSLWR